MRSDDCWNCWAQNYSSGSDRSSRKAGDCRSVAGCDPAKCGQAAADSAASADDPRDGSDCVVDSAADFALEHGWHSDFEQVDDCRRRLSLPVAAGVAVDDPDGCPAQRQLRRRARNPSLREGVRVGVAWSSCFYFSFPVPSVTSAADRHRHRSRPPEEEVPSAVRSWTACRDLPSPKGLASFPHPPDPVKSAQFPGSL